MSRPCLCASFSVIAVASVAGQIDRHLERIVHDRRDREHRCAVGGADDGDDLLALDQLAILRDGLHRIVLVVARDQDELAALDPALRVDLVDGDLRAALDLDADERRRSAQRAGKADLDRLLRVAGRECPQRRCHDGGSKPHSECSSSHRNLHLARISRHCCPGLQSFPFIRAGAAPARAAASVRPRPRRLEGGGRAQNVGLVQRLRHDVQADRQAVAREPARHRGRRQPAQIDRIGVGDPGDDVLAVELDRHVAADVEGRRRRGRRQQQIEALEELPHLLAELVAREDARRNSRRWSDRARARSTPATAGSMMSRCSVSGFFSRVPTPA